VTKTPRVLLIDDNPADVSLIGEASAGGKYQTKFQNFTDGEKAISHLRTIGQNAEAAKPDLVILDLNLPRMNGKNVLAFLKTDRELRGIPVVVFSSSQSHWEISHCYELGANCYVRKTGDLDGFVSAIRSIEEFWFGTASLPEEG